MSAHLLQSRRGAMPLSGGRWLTPLSVHWTEAALEYLSTRAMVTRVTVASLRGSAPREPGASMLVDMDETLGTIGGGRLEWQATDAAREVLRDRDTPPVRVHDLILGPDLGQCCGGRVLLWIERLTRDDRRWLREAASRLRNGECVSVASSFCAGIASHRVLCSPAGLAGVDLHRASADEGTLLEILKPQRLPLWIFGAGHVGQALIQLLSQLSLFDVTWIDSRAALLPPELPDCVSARVCANPPDLIETAAADAHYIVLTHDHGLDYELCRRILLRGDARWLGLIGSASKSARFRSRLLRDGISGEQLSRLKCPIGIEGIASKLPAAIAIAIAAQLLQQHAGSVAAKPRKRHRDCSVACESCGAQGREVP